ncbi:hypothetical protein NQ315_005408 [Exocentrus adspersus]|uniref:Protein Spindly n=1 Tax=Exocentrus adspersus TaxID=1586481 RepID=A0AAV8W243_9CUCU|nr:hypothetical protein NQ315_005408 [Exocentrus adspersus]
MADVTLLPEDYNGLKKEYLGLRNKLDSVNQELYGCKRQLKVVEALQLEYQNEIELLQSEANTEKIKREEKIVHLEENIVIQRSKFSERIHTLEAEVILKDEGLKQLKSEIELLKKDNAKETPTEDVNKLIQELMCLKSENEVLLENEEKLKSSLEALQKNSAFLEEALTECKEELLSVKESLSCKRDELVEANDLVQKLNDELFCLKSELESYRSRPLNSSSKGNSLFAEVDDRRVYLQETINRMKTEYIAMKQERAKHLNMISHLKTENKTLCERWKKDIEEKEDDQDMVVKSYKDRIEVLESLVEKYKQNLSAKPVVISVGTFSEIEFYQTMLNNKVKELEELREELKSRGLTHTILSTALKEANKEIRKWRLEATLKQCQIELQQNTPLEVASTKNIDEEIEKSSTELKQTEKDPHRTSRKHEKNKQSSVNDKHSTVKRDDDVIPINDSNDDIQFVDTETGVKFQRSAKEDATDRQILGILKQNKDNIMQSTVDDEDIADGMDIEKSNSCLEGSVEEKNEFLKEREISEDTSKKVTFSRSTVSPKISNRTALRKNCKRLLLPKPVYIPSE